MNREILFRAWDTKRQKMYYDGNYWLPALENAPDPSAANCYPIKVTSAGILFSQKIGGDGEVEISLPDGKTIQAYTRWESDALSAFGLKLMQYTGLRDSKRNKEFPEGQRIFDGDVLGKKGFKKIFKRIVRWNTDLCCFQAAFLDGSGIHLFTQKELSTWEVIGNKWDNPDLLKG